MPAAPGAGRTVLAGIDAIRAERRQLLDESRRLAILHLERTPGEFTSAKIVKVLGLQVSPRALGHRLASAENVVQVPTSPRKPKRYTHANWAVTQREKPATGERAAGA